MKINQNVRYAESHEWARKEGDLIVVGISDHAQESLGDIVFVEFPKVNSHIEAKATFGVIESVKAASDLYLPLSGKIVQVNEALNETPEIINRDCYGEGWLVKFIPDSIGDYDKLLSPSDYEKTITEK